MFKNRQSSGRLRIRTWNEFFDKHSFKSPQFSSEHIMSNVVHYQANYLAIISVLLGLYILFYSTWLFFLFIIPILVGSGYYLFIQRQRPLQFGNNLIITRSQVRIGFSLLTFLIFLYFDGFSSILIILFGIGVSILHGAAHNSQMSSSRGYNGGGGPGPMQGMGSHMNNGYGGQHNNHQQSPYSSHDRGPMDLMDEGYDQDEEDPEASAELRRQQARHRANFRATMRAKYLQPQNH